MSDVYRRTGIVAAAATVLLSWLLLLPLGTPNRLVRWSYDLLQPALPRRDHTNLALIYMDEQALQEYGQKPGRWSRSIQARLLNRLTEDQARVVVFDVTMTQASDPAQDDELARAIRRNGRVVLAGDKAPVPGIRLGYAIVPPLELFETNAAAWGTAKVQADPDRVGRRSDAGDDEQLGLVWAAATVVNAPATGHPERRLQQDRWLNYYGSARPFQSVSMTYTNAETRERNFFRDKAVFIGGQPETLSQGETTDVFGTPFTKWNGRFIRGLEITAMAYANLVHEEWLRRMGLTGELVLLLITGCVASFTLQIVRWRTALWLSSLMAVLLVTAAAALLLSCRIWFPWVIVGLVQMPCALVFRLFPARETIHSPSPEAEPGAETKSWARAPEGLQHGQLEIPDHTLIRCIGEGAYGQVWVARDAVGRYHAVKVVYRSRFGVAGPYERALRGIEKFMPVSRSHQGFVHILRMGRNDPAGFFFYIMEAGDDQERGQQIDPLTYAPRTLRSELNKRQMIPPRECLEFMLALTDAVDRLHRHQLIHRDIKPDNIIFVNRRPKLADIDLVTDLSPQGKASWIGTEGYMAPEGPGTAAADVFSLGRILYVALTGKRPEKTPELPTRIASEPDCGFFLELNHIICKACEFDLRRRYSSAAAMRVDLRKAFRRLEK